MVNTGRFRLYYNRTLSPEFSKLIEEGGSLRWLFQFVRDQADLDFLIGRNSSKEWISVYRGLTRIISITPFKESHSILIDADSKYKNILSRLYGIKNVNENFQNDLEFLIKEIDEKQEFDRYYKNKKEGYYQNLLSRKYGICGKPEDDFVIIDKEAVIGHDNQSEKDKIFGSIQAEYKRLQKDISILNSERYGKNLEKKSIGNELDFLALDKEGNILLIEYKHGTNTSGIYLSPLQIGLYYDVFKKFAFDELSKSVLEMLKQKQKIGLINPGWAVPSKINNIIPVLIISEYNYNSIAQQKFKEILNFIREKKGDDFLSNLRSYNFTKENGLTEWIND
jgi:hypothetical protein